jgi:hypothetical protein
MRKNTKKRVFVTRLCVYVSSVVVPYRTRQTQAENGTENLDHCDSDCDTSDYVRAFLQELMGGLHTWCVIKISIIGRSTRVHTFSTTTARVIAVL